MIGRLGWLALWAVACSGPTDDKDLPDTDETDGDDDTNEDSGLPTDSAPEGPEYFEPEYFIVEAEFGWDSTTRQLVSVGTPYGDFPPIIRAMYGSVAWEADGFTYDSEHYCQVQLPLTQPAPSPRFLADPDAWMGFDYNSADGLATDCNLGDGLYDFDPAAWGEDPIGELLAWEWGVGVGVILPDVATQWAGEEVEANVFGGIILNNALPYGHDEYTALNREIDASFQVILDDELRYTFLPASEIFLGDNIATGWYTIFYGGVWSFE
jgi:hypothetical protein